MSAKPTCALLIILGLTPRVASAVDWRYCLAPSRADHKVYVSPPFPMDAFTGDAETAFGQMLNQARIPRDNVQCPRGDDKSMISQMRRYALKVNRELGNAAIELDWRP